MSIYSFVIGLRALMVVFFGILKRIQLFLLAFSFAAGSMFFAGIASGKLERSETYVSISEVFAVGMVRNFPGFVEFAARFGVDESIAQSPAGDEVYGSVQAAGLPDQPRIQSVSSASNSLRALQSRRDGTQPSPQN